MQLELFPKGSVIFREGQESNNKMYVIAQGKVAIVMKHFYSIQQQDQKNPNNANTTKGLSGFSSLAAS